MQFESLLEDLKRGRGDLLQIALHLAKDEYPDLDIQAYVARVQEAGRFLQTSCKLTDNDAVRISALNHLLFEKMGLCGNEENYDDPRNSFINDVLDTGYGLPISLSLLYLHLGRQQGLKLQGVGFPGHFLVQLDGDQGIHWLDPFYKGVLVSQRELAIRLELVYGDMVTRLPAMSELLAPVSDVDLLVRMLRNLKRHYRDQQNHLRLEQILSRIVSLNPDLAPEYKERAQVYEALECPVGAIKDYQKYLDLTPSAGANKDIERHIAELEKKQSGFH